MVAGAGFEPATSGSHRARNYESPRPYEPRGIPGFPTPLPLPDILQEALLYNVFFICENVLVQIYALMKHYTPHKAYNAFRS